MLTLIGLVYHIKKDSNSVFYYKLDPSVIIQPKMKLSTGWLELSKLASSQKIGLHSNETLLTSFDLYFLLLD
ncbi:unnamed protein product [Brugia pahangi]|uniref:Uncharacterized protein n=1 Tax=Brugia pahangi TaxID=6280 RepID=A0A0N4T362_BRUPA|nr:unnamed protein product [Brugia pahangi]